MNRPHDFSAKNSVWVGNGFRHEWQKILKSGGLVIIQPEKCLWHQVFYKISPKIAIKILRENDTVLINDIHVIGNSAREQSAFVEILKKKKCKLHVFTPHLLKMNTPSGDRFFQDIALEAEKEKMTGKLAVPLRIKGLGRHPTLSRQKIKILNELETGDMNHSDLARKHNIHPVTLFK